MAQDKLEKRVYYLDCSLTMIGSEKYPEDNIWEDVKSNLKDAINSVTNETTELLVVPFANNCDFNPSFPLKCYEQAYATESGKRKLREYIDNLPKPNKTNQTMTYHKIPLIDFKYRIDETKTTYMFLMTDGYDDEYFKYKTRTFEDIVRNWHDYTGVKDKYDISDVYGIYVMLNDKYNIKTREELIKETDYFWQVNTANVNINLIRLKTDAVYNIRNENIIAIPIEGNTQGITFELSTPYPNSAPFEIKKPTVQGDKLIVPILPKENIDVYSLDESKDYAINVSMKGANDYTILVTSQIKLKCISKRENSVIVTHTQAVKVQSQSIWDKIKSIIGIDVDRSASFGTVHSYPSCLWVPDSITPVIDSIYFDFSQDAKLNSQVYAEFQFVDNDSNPYSDDVLTIIDAGIPLPNNILKVTSADKAKELKFIFSSDAKPGKYQGYFKLINHNHLHRIDHYFLNHIESKVLTDDKQNPSNQVNIFQWTLHYKKHCNPLLIKLLIIFGLLILLIVLYYLSRYILNKIAPRFPRDKRLNFQFINSLETDFFSVYKRDIVDFGKILVAKGCSELYINNFKPQTYVKHIVIMRRSLLSWFKKQDFWGGWTYTFSAILPDNIEKIEVIPINNHQLRIDTYYSDGSKNEHLLNYSRSVIDDTQYEIPKSQLKVSIKDCVEQTNQ